MAATTTPTCSTILLGRASRRQPAPWRSPGTSAPTHPVPEEAPIKSSLWLATPNIAGAVKLEFGNHVCKHAAGTHKPLRGVDDDGFYVTASSKCENYHSATCRRIARCIQLFIEYPDTAQLNTVAPADVTEPAGAAPPHIEPDLRPPPEPPPNLSTLDKIDYQLAMTNGEFRISESSNIIRGKFLPKSAICYNFLHKSFRARRGQGAETSPRRAVRRR